MPLDPEILQCFLDECSGLLMQSSKAAARCRSGQEGPEDVEQLRRVFHTLKGNAAVVGADVLASAAGSLERLMRIFETRRLGLDDRALGLIERTQTRFESMVSAIRRGAELSFEPEWTRHLEDSVNEINAVYLEGADAPIIVREPVPPIAPSQANQAPEPEISAPDWERPAVPKRNRSTDVVSTPVPPPKKAPRRAAPFGLSGRLDFAPEVDLGVLAARIRPLIEPYGAIASWRVGADDSAEIAFAFADASLTDLIALARVLAREDCLGLSLELGEGPKEERPMRSARIAFLENARHALSADLESESEAARPRRAAAARAFGLAAGAMGFPSRSALALELAGALSGDAAPAPTIAAAAQRLRSPARRDVDPAELGAARALRRQRGVGPALELLGAWIGHRAETTRSLEPREVTWSWRELHELDDLLAAFDELAREGEVVGAALRAVNTRELKAVLWIDPSTAVGYSRLAESLRWERARIQRRIPARLDVLDELLAVLDRAPREAGSLAARAFELASRLRIGPAAPLLDHLRLSASCVGVVRPEGGAVPVELAGDDAQVDLHLLRLLRRPLTALFHGVLRAIKASALPGARLALTLSAQGSAGARITLEAVGLGEPEEAPFLEGLRAIGVRADSEAMAGGRRVRLFAEQAAAASRALVARLGGELVALVPAPSALECHDPRDETIPRQFAELVPGCPKARDPAVTVFLNGRDERWALDEAIGVEEVYRADAEACACETRGGEARVIDLVRLREQLEDIHGG